MATASQSSPLTAADSAAKLREVPCAKSRLTSLVLLFADIVAILASIWFGVHLWGHVNSAIDMDNYFDLWLAVLVFAGGYAFFGLYAAAGLSPVEELRRTVVATVLVSLLLTAAVFLSKSEGYSRGAFLTSGALLSILIPLNRAFLRARFSSQSWWGVPVLVLGAGHTARLLMDSLKSQPALGLKPVACLDDDLSKLGECGDIPVLGPLYLAPELARSLNIRHALVAMPRIDHLQLLRILEHCGSEFTHITVIPNLFGVASLWVSTKDLGGVLGLQIRQNLLVPFNRWLKRGMDFVLAVLLGLAALPFLGLAALWIRLSTGGSPLYYQNRGGESGSTIRVWKLRTMHADAENLLSSHLLEFPEARDEWQRYFKLKKDPRILPGIGQLLRRTSLDELPQLWSVLRGEMSLVGPRPFPEYHLEQFRPEFRSLRAKVTPGLTGLWQVSARSNGDLKMQEALDTYYIRNWSPWLDLHILARTVRAVIFSKGAY
jgi:Undecaprenyl-phosphate galactose phosphotransferase, WbaP/exopolysaccharide biosynthesis polyprenyl glycosylphosphotransferase